MTVTLPGTPTVTVQPSLHSLFITEVEAVIRKKTKRVRKIYNRMLERLLYLADSGYFVESCIR